MKRWIGIVILVAVCAVAAFADEKSDRIKDIDTQMTTLKGQIEQARVFIEQAAGKLNYLQGAKDELERNEVKKTEKPDRRNHGKKNHIAD